MLHMLNRILYRYQALIFHGVVHSHLASHLFKTWEPQCLIETQPCPSFSHLEALSISQNTHFTYSSLIQLTHHFHPCPTISHSGGFAVEGMTCTWWCAKKLVFCSLNFCSCCWSSAQKLESSSSSVLQLLQCYFFLQRPEITQSTQSTWSPYVATSFRSMLCAAMEHGSEHH